MSINATWYRREHPSEDHGAWSVHWMPRAAKLRRYTYAEQIAPVDGQCRNCDGVAPIYQAFHVIAGLNAPRLRCVRVRGHEGPHMTKPELRWRPWRWRSLYAHYWTI